VQLPDGSGLALLEDLTGRPGRSRPPVIALTGGALPQQHAAAMRAAATPYSTSHSWLLT